MEVHCYPNLEALPADYAELFAAGAAVSPFLSREWFDILVAHSLDPGDEILVYGAVGASGRPVATLPLLRSRPEENWLTGRRLRALQNFYAPLFQPLLTSGPEGEQGLWAISRFLAGERPAWDALDLGPLPVEQPIFAWFQQALTAANFTVKPYFRFGNFFLPAEGLTWDQYFAGRPTQVRNTVTRKMRRLEREGIASFRLLVRPDEAADGVMAYQRVYADSWKRPEPYPSFVPELIRMAACHGWLRLGILEINGEPAAAQLWLLAGRKAHIYKLAYREQFREHSPGTVLFAYMMRQMLDRESVAEVDFLTGDDHYKRDWMSHRRERWGVLAMHRRTWRGCALAFREYATWRLKVLGNRHQRGLVGDNRSLPSPTCGRGVGGEGCSFKYLPPHPNPLPHEWGRGD